jgi:hypothetical protein
MVIFVSILVVGLIYAWMKGALKGVSGSSSTRVASAVGEGSVAIQMVHGYLND